MVSSELPPEDSEQFGSIFEVRRYFALFVSVIRTAGWRVLLLLRYVIRACRYIALSVSVIRTTGWRVLLLLQYVVQDSRVARTKFGDVLAKFHQSV